MIIAGGLYPNVNTDNLRITRSTLANDSESFYLPIEDSKNTKLFSQDHIMVPYFDNENPHNIVEILGADRTDVDPDKIFKMGI